MVKKCLEGWNLKRQEIKEHLKDIIVSTEEVIQSLRSKQDWFNEMKRKLQDLDKHIAVQGEDLFCMEITLEEIQYAFFEQEVEPVREEVDTLRWDIELYADELSKARADKLYEQYADFEKVLLHMDTSDYDEIEYAVECLEKAVGLLKGMCGERVD